MQASYPSSRRLRRERLSVADRRLIRARGARQLHQAGRCGRSSRLQRASTGSGIASWKALAFCARSAGRHRQQRFGSAASKPSRRPGHPARPTGWHIHRRERPRLVARARDHRRVPVRRAPRRCPRTQTCCPTPGHRGADGLARQGGRAALVDDLEGGARSDLVRKGRIVAVRHHRQVIARPAGRMKTARGTPAGLTDVPFALVYVVESTCQPRRLAGSA